MTASPGKRLVEFFGKFIVTVLLVALSFTPTWIFLLVRNLLDPHGFWQKFLVLGVGVYFLGGLQIICLIVVIALTVVLWMDD